MEIVKEFSQRFAEGGSDVGRNYFHPEIIWDTSSSGLPSAGVYHGREEVRKFFRDWLGPWRDYEIEYREYVDAGDSVVCVFRQAGTGKGSGIRSERDFFALWYLEDSKVSASVCSSRASKHSTPPGCPSRRAASTRGLYLGCACFRGWRSNQSP